MVTLSIWGLWIGSKADLLGSKLPSCLTKGERVYTVEVKTNVKAPLDKVFDLIGSIQNLPKYHPAYRKVEIVKRDGNLILWKAEAENGKFQGKLTLFPYKPQEGFARIEIEHRDDAASGTHGVWTLKKIPSGTELNFRVDLAGPPESKRLIESVYKKGKALFSEMLENFKKEAERDLI